uniref:Rho GTPase activating protein n=1 Tax=Philodina roseola TaxID=96448 RepID=B5AHC1_PHIRO|nr:rho GTPase activating protein [Philodina roseola]
MKFIVTTSLMMSGLSTDRTRMRKDVVVVLFSSVFFFDNFSRFLSRRKTMSNMKEGWLKIKLHNQSKWHRRFCIVDWDRSILFFASRPDTRYREWIQLLSNIVINDCDLTYLTDTNSATNSHLVLNTIEIKTDNGNTTHFLQADTKKECDAWLLALRRTAYSRIGGGIFGQSLEETFKYSRDKTSSVPLVIRQCCEFLLEFGSTSVGLFRVPGKQSSIRELRDLYDRGLNVELNTSYSPATISSLLKNFLQSLPEPIIPTKYFDEFLEIGCRLKYHQGNDLKRLKNLIETTLPPMNFATLSYLCLFLKKITDHVERTKMDTENLAVVFGNNLIRQPDDCDLNMIRGHSYNLLPLIKGLIDHSDFLFVNNSSEQFQESYEQTNESVAKSSGFSSFSSLLSTGEHPLGTKSRSASMPSICIGTCSSIDSGSKSLDDDLVRTRRPLSFNEETLQSTSNQTMTNSRENEQKKSSSSHFLRIRSTNDEILKTNSSSADDILLKSSDESTPVHSTTNDSLLDVPVVIRKMEKYSSKKSFADRLSKPFNSLKLTMPKAFQSHSTSNVAEPNLTLRKSVQEKKSSSQTQTQSNHLKEILSQKELIIVQLTRTCQDERQRFEKEIQQLRFYVEQLQNENLQLKRQLNLQ